MLQNTQIENLPQLVNVLKGEMSLVGPRPLPWPRLASHLAIGSQAAVESRAELRRQPMLRPLRGPRSLPQPRLAPHLAIGSQAPAGLPPLFRAALGYRRGI